MKIVTLVVLCSICAAGVVWIGSDLIRGESSDLADKQIALVDEQIAKSVHTRESDRLYADQVTPLINDDGRSYYEVAAGGLTFTSVINNDLVVQKGDVVFVRYPLMDESNKIMKNIKKMSAAICIEFNRKTKCYRAIVER